VVDRATKATRSILFKKNNPWLIISLLSN